MCETIGAYFYSLRDPANNELFYVGKGVGNRCFAHVAEARANERGIEKLETIRAILARGDDVGIDIVRHGLSDEVALEVEAALIDTLGLTDSGNLVRGHRADRRIGFSMPLIEQAVSPTSRPRLPQPVRATVP